MSGADLLVELGTEELPPTALRQLGEAFAKGMAAVRRYGGRSSTKYRLQAVRD